MTEQKRVERLARLVGFEWVNEEHFVHGPLMHGGKTYPGYWTYKGQRSVDGHFFSKLPDLFHSLDALFKWAVPELRRRGYDYVLFGWQNDRHKAEIAKPSFEWGTELVTSAVTDEPAQALFEAIEKLLDMEER